ncbi:MAG: CoA-binding protein [Thermodesulfobacteriota bacterium]|nr:CoA-binding protein [Thermodesulfobacteriota bacterium]
MYAKELDCALYPTSVAVVGASENSTSSGYNFLRHLIDYKFSGRIYPVNPNQQEILGLQAYPTLKEIPESVDFVICCIPAPKVFDLLPECHEKEVKVLHLFTARMSETGSEDGARLEKEILKEIRRMGIRLIGPNCMGVYSPASGISFGYEFPKESGPLGMFFQSGGAATEFVRYANLRGIRFSKVISYGNALDLNESDFLEYFTHDTETKVIASYMEGTKDGQRFVDTLHKATSVKPVVILKAGRGTAGSRAAASHTAAMAGSSKMWESALLQAGAIQARTMDELLDLVVSFCFTKPILGNSVGIVGGGGGRSVLSADIWEEAGFYLKPLPSAIREEIKKTTQETWWNWVENPVDVSIMPDQHLRGNLLRSMAKNPEYDLIIVNVTVESPRGKEQLIASIKEEADDIIQVKEEGKKPVAAVLNTGPLGIEDFENWRWRLIAEQKSRLIAAQVPVFSSVGQAAETLSRVAQYYQKRKS